MLKVLNADEEEIEEDEEDEEEMLRQYMLKHE